MTFFNKLCVIKYVYDRDALKSDYTDGMNGLRYSTAEYIGVYKNGD